jgi:hypothetical protein
MNLFKNIFELLTSAAIACIGIEVLPHPVYISKEFFSLVMQFKLLQGKCFGK